MKNLKNKLSVVIVGLIIFCFASTALAKDKWINLQSKNFNVVSNADEKKTKEITQKLEQFRYTLVQLYPNVPESEPVPVTVVIFRDDRSFNPFKPIYKGKVRKDISGYFQSGEDGNIIAIDSTVETLRVIFHEYVHLLLNFSTVELPPWINEGLAELYSTFEIDKNEVVLGTPLPFHVEYLQNNGLKLIPLKELIQVDFNSPAYNESDKSSFFYTQSWLFVHYLMISERGVRKPQLFKFIKLIRIGKTPEQAFTEAFGVGFEEMQDTLRGYVNNKYYPVVKYQLKAPALDKNLPIQTLSEAQTQVYLGNLLLQIGRLEDAEKSLQQAKALDTNLVETLENLGFIAMKQEKYTQAKEYFQQAIARSSKNYQIYYQYANALYLMGKIDNKLSGEVLKEIKNNAQSAIKLRPEFAQAYNLAALSELGLGEDYKTGLEQAKMAVLLAPRKKQFLLTQAQLQIATTDYQGAKKILQLLLKEEDIELKTKAELLLREIEEKAQNKE